MPKTKRYTRSLELRLVTLLRRYAKDAETEPACAFRAAHEVYLEELHTQENE